MSRIASVRHRGVTLIELVIVIVLISILSAVAMTSLSARAQHSVTVQADQLRRNISHIQLLAISRGSRLKLAVTDSGASYTVYLCPDSACASPAALNDPATGQNFKVNLDGTTLSGNDLYFDSLGRPQASGSLISSSQTYTLSGSPNIVITVLPLTGFASTPY